MRAKEHSAYEEERKHLGETQEWITKEAESLAKNKEQLNQEIIALRKEVSSALDERLLLKLQMQDMVSEDLEHMDKAQKSPYFGRVNFQEKYKDEVEVIYIGKFGIYDSKEGEMLVLDWRAPMANIYYSGMDEEVSYQTPKGTIEGQMHLKRRYVMVDGILTEIHDEKSLQDNIMESISQDAGFLIESLNKSTKGRLTEIVATIQDQQNKIIRSDHMMPLIVQGVAGSGKTTIALHRMAYIIYNRKQDREAQYMVVAPNKLFLNYIEAILPDLGVDNVFQTTFEEWALGKLGKGIKLVGGHNKLNQLLTESEEVAKAIALSAKLRGSIVFKKLIDIRLAQLERSLLPREGIQFEGVTIFTYREISQLFLTSHLHLPLQGRIKQLGETIKKRLKNKIPVIESGIMGNYQRLVTELKQTCTDMDEIRPQIIELYDERDKKIKEIKKQIPLFVKNFIKQMEIPTAKTFYFDIYEDKEWMLEKLAKHMEQEVLERIIEALKMNYEKSQVETEDLGPLLYCQIKLYGLGNEQKYAHIVVDEAQDLDEMKLTVLREVSINDAFTLVGDLSQGIYGYKGINNWEHMMARAFEGKKYHYYEMTTSYRSTIEIIELANAIIEKCTEFKPLKAQPVLRHGDVPKLIVCQDEEKRIEQLMADIKGFQEKEMHSICILTETEEQVAAVYKLLEAKGQQIQWIQNEEQSYEGGIVIMTGALAKGLEFDAVLIYDVSHKQREITPLDIKLLYVMITRALHHLNLYAIDKPSELLRDIGCLSE